MWWVVYGCGGIRINVAASRGSGVEIRFQKPKAISYFPHFVRSSQSTGFSVKTAPNSQSKIRTPLSQ